MRTSTTQTDARNALDDAQIVALVAPKLVRSGGTTDPNAAPSDAHSRPMLRSQLTGEIARSRPLRTIAMPEKPAIATANSVRVENDSTTNPAA